MPREILGGYRFLPATDITFRPDGQPYLATGHMFRFSDNFIENFLPQTVELGRSFVTLEYQSTQQLAKSLYALDNLWDGLGALTVKNPQSEILLREDDHVSELRPRGARHDSLFPQAPFRRSRRPHHCV